MGKAIIIKEADFSSVAVDTIEIDVPTPTISISLGGQVTISSENDVYYTTDGTTPTKSNGTKYTAPFTVALNTVVKAVAFIGNIDSDVASATYNATILPPSINIAQDGLVTITNNTPEATVYYNVNSGSDPDSTSTQYTTPFTVNDGDVVKAVAIYGQLAPSTVVSATAVVVSVIENKSINKTPISGGYNWTPVTNNGFCISPKIPVSDRPTFVYKYINATFETDRVFEYSSGDANGGGTGADFWEAKSGPTGGGTGSVTKRVTGENTTFLRVVHHMDAYGTYIQIGGVKVYEYTEGGPIVRPMAGS